MIDFLSIKGQFWAKKSSDKKAISIELCPKIKFQPVLESPLQVGF